MVLPSSVRSIGEGAFSGCMYFHRVDYYGDEASFQSISVGNDNDKFLKASIKYH
jgi:hypothetical protein